MSLNQKYTWNDFLKENPDFKGKKRTSPAAKKAFEAACKTKIKEILKDRLVWIEKETERMGKKREALVSDIKAAKKVSSKRKIQSKIGSSDKYLNRLTKMTEKTKQVQKSV